MTDFDTQVAALRDAVEPRHKPFGKKKADCSPEEWAAHLAWQRAYLNRPGHRVYHEVYRNRSLARKALA